MNILNGGVRTFSKSHSIEQIDKLIKDESVQINIRDEYERVICKEILDIKIMIYKLRVIHDVFIQEYQELINIKDIGIQSQQNQERLQELKEMLNEFSVLIERAVDIIQTPNSSPEQISQFCDKLKSLNIDGIIKQNKIQIELPLPPHLQTQQMTYKGRTLFSGQLAKDVGVSLRDYDYELFNELHNQLNTKNNKYEVNFNLGYDNEQLTMQDQMKFLVDQESQNILLDNKNIIQQVFESSIKKSILGSDRIKKGQLQELRLENIQFKPKQQAINVITPSTENYLQMIKDLLIKGGTTAENTQNLSVSHQSVKSGTVGRSFTKKSFLKDTIKRTDNLTSTILQKYQSGEFPITLSGYQSEEKKKLEKKQKQLISKQPLQSLVRSRIEYQRPGNLEKANIMRQEAWKYHVYATDIEDKADAEEQFIKREIEFSKELTILYNTIRKRDQEKLTSLHELLSDPEYRRQIEDFKYKFTQKDFTYQDYVVDFANQVFNANTYNSLEPDDLFTLSLINKTRKSSVNLKEHEFYSPTYHYQIKMQSQSNTDRALSPSWNKLLKANLNDLDSF